MPGSSFFGFGSAVIDGQERVAFTAEVGVENSPGGDARTVVAERDNVLKLIVGPDTLPGLVPNERIQGIDRLSGNTAGQLGFFATFVPVCETPDDPFACEPYQGAGYWLVGEDGQPQLVARTGEAITAVPDNAVRYGRTGRLRVMNIIARDTVT